MKLAFAIVIGLFGATVVLAGLLHSTTKRIWHKCAWCGIWVSDCGDEQITMPGGINDSEISHGICKDCAGEQIAKLNIK
jgi:hypothetical protein